MTLQSDLITGHVGAWAQRHCDIAGEFECTWGGMDGRKNTTASWNSRKWPTNYNKLDVRIPHMNRTHLLTDLPIPAYRTDVNKQANCVITQKPADWNITHLERKGDGCVWLCNYWCSWELVSTTGTHWDGTQVNRTRSEENHAAAAVH